MASVTQRIQSIQQPRGGYLPIKCFSKEVLDDGITLNAEENVHPSLIGIAVDYLTRFMSGNSVEQAFHISTLGAIQIGMQDKATTLKSKISGLDDDSIIVACKLAGFDVCYRSSINKYKPIEDIAPDIPTIENIRTMVKRSLSFWGKYGPVVHSEPTFEGGYSSVVNTGDGDYVTKDTLWDFKVSKSAPTSKNTLQVLMYYVMGLHSVHDFFKDIVNLGFFNPRLNAVYICPVSSISKDTIREIEDNVICYNTANSVSISQNSFLNFPRTHTPSIDYYSVADISQATGQKKGAVYADIRAGKLNAIKKGNKYIIPQHEFRRYVEHIETQQKIKLTLSLVFGAIAIILLLIFSRICAKGTSNIQRAGGAARNFFVSLSQNSHA